MTLLETLLDMAEHDFGPDEPHRILLLSLANEIRRLHAHAGAMAMAHDMTCRAAMCPINHLCRAVRNYRRDYPKEIP